ncbi:MAG: hypothetical protein AAB920_01215 [Patescibacteria group bacterium]
MVEVKNFSESLDTHLERLGAHINVERERPSSELSSPREIVKNSLKNYAEDLTQIRNVSVAEAQAGLVSQATPASDMSGSLPNYLFNSDISEGIKQEVKALVDFVFSDNLESAIKESRKRSAFVQDAFHDALVDKLMPELVKRGIFK